MISLLTTVLVHFTEFINLFLSIRNIWV